MAYNLKYSAYTPENSTPLFTAQGTAGFVWDPGAQEYRIAPDLTLGPKELFTRIDSLDPRSFHDLYADKIEELARGGTEEQKAWVKALEDDMRNGERTR